MKMLYCLVDWLIDLISIWMKTIPLREMRCRAAVVPVLPSNVSVSHNSVTVSQHKQYQNPEAEANVTDLSFTDYLHLWFPPGMCQSVFCEKRQMKSWPFFVF